MRASPVVAGLVAAALLAAAPASADPTRALVRHAVRAHRPFAFADASGVASFTARLPRGRDARAFGLAPVAPGIGSIRLPPERLEDFLAAHPGVELSATPPRRALLDVSQGWVGSTTYRSTTGRDGKGVVVGLVDTGLDVRHPDFRNADGSSRVAWMLASGTPRGVHPDVERSALCDDPATSSCGVWSAHDIDAAADADLVTVMRDPDGHGTHVSSIAAGNGGAAKKYVGMAPGAAVIMSAPVSTEGFSDADILNGARFVFERADNMPTCPDGLTICDPDAYTCANDDACVADCNGPTCPVPVRGHCARAPATACTVQGCEREACTPMRWPCALNLSLGGDYGAHDGTSDLEQGLAALVANQPGHVIVVAAGNSGAIYPSDDGPGPLGIHTEALVPEDARVRVPMVVPEATNGELFVWVRFQPGDEVTVGLEGPGGATWVSQVSQGDDQSYDDGGNSATVVNDEVDADVETNGASTSAAIIVSGGWADQSEFAITLEGHGIAELWVTSAGDIGPDVAVGGAQFERGLKEGTIAVPATSASVIGVGATINRIVWQPYEGPAIEIVTFDGSTAPIADGTAYFSASGPAADGTPKPEVSAPGAFVAAAMAAAADPRVAPGGLFDPGGCPDPQTKCYVVDGTHAVAVGTSMAAPHVAGLAALLLEGDPTLTQAAVSDAFVAGARHAGGPVPYDFELGAGVAQVVGAQSTLGPEIGVDVVDPSRSWYALSSGYARTDSALPVWGTVELRRSDGAVAMGIDGAELTVTCENGQILQPLTKLKPGLFQFSFTGDVGGAGKPIALDVTYAGVSLGARSIPVGTDAFNDALAVDATSGACTCRAASDGPVPRSLPALGVVALAALAAHGRRRRS